MRMISDVKQAAWEPTPQQAATLPETGGWVGRDLLSFAF